MNFLIDPLQIYHRQPFAKPRFFSDQRFQNIGKINSYLATDPEYDSIILGPSHADNFRPKHVAGVMGWNKVMKLTISAGTPMEQDVTCERALRTGKVKHIIWSLSDVNKRDAWNRKRPFPLYLYNDNVFDDHVYLFNVDIFHYSLQLLFNTSPWSPDMDKVNYWMDKSLPKFVRFNNIRHIKKLQLQEDGKRQELMKILKKPLVQNKFAALDAHILNVVARHPEVEFYLFFPPLPHYKIVFESPGNVPKMIQMYRHTVEKCAGLKNVKIFAFDTVESIVCNLANYKDHFHYGAEVNTYIVQSMKEDRHRLTVENIDQFEKRLLELLTNFKIYSDFDTAVAFTPGELQKIRKLK